MDTPYQKCLLTQIEVLEKNLTPRKIPDINIGDDSVRRLREFPYGDDFVHKRSQSRETPSGDECTCSCGLPNKKYCMLTSVGRKNESRRKIVWAPMSICKVFSSSTPTVPYSTADILYGNDVAKRDQADELRRNSIGELEKSKDSARQKSSRELDHPNNRRPNSKSGSRRSISIDAVSFDKDPDPLKTIPSSLPPAKPTNHFRPNGIRSNLLKGDAVYTPKTSNGAASGREPDDLVATGTEWGSYNNKPQQQSQQLPGAQGAALSSSIQPTTPQQQTRVGSNNNSYPAKVASSSSSSHQSMSSTTNNAMMVPQRKYASNNMRPIVVQQNNVSGKKLNNKIEEDPKYTDPMLGAPASFQQRIIELGALEGDTVRWERTKKLKKKKQDRDS